MFTIVYGLLNSSVDIQTFMLSLENKEMQYIMDEIILVSFLTSAILLVIYYMQITKKGWIWQVS